MPPEGNDPAYLRDMLDACDRIGRFIARKSIDDYRGDELLRSGVERQVGIAVGAGAKQGRNSKDTKSAKGSKTEGRNAEARRSAE